MEKTTNIQIHGKTVERSKKGSGTSPSLFNQYVGRMNGKAARYIERGVRVGEDSNLGRCM